MMHSGPSVRHRSHTGRRFHLPALTLAGVLVLGAGAAACGDDDDLASGTEATTTTPTEGDTTNGDDDGGAGTTATTDPTTSTGSGAGGDEGDTSTTAPEDTEGTSDSGDGDDSGDDDPPTPWEPITLPAAADPLPEDTLVATRIVPNGGGDPADQEVVVLSARGAELTTIATRIGTAEGGAFDLTLTPDRETVLWAQAGSACGTSIMAAPVDGSSEPERIVSDAHSVAVSPSQTHLALDTGDPCFGEGEISIVPLRGGDAVTVAIDLTDGQWLGSLAFVDDDTVLATRSDDPGTMLRIDVGSGEVEEVALERPDSTIAALDSADDGEVTAVLTVTDGRSIELAALAALGPDGVTSETIVDIGDATSVLDAVRLGTSTAVVVQGDGDLSHLLVDGVEVGAGIGDIDA